MTNEQMVVDPGRPWPYYEDFRQGAVLPALPGLTVTDADNALYRAVTGDQHLLSADRDVYRRVGGAGALVNPGLVMQVSIGQSTMATRQAIANLYYRSLRVLSPVEVGETLTTRTRVLGLADASPKNGTYRGKVWLGITTSAGDRVVAAYERCALVRSGLDAAVGHSDEIPGPSDSAPLAELAGTVPAWDLSSLPATDWAVGDSRVDPLSDHVDLAAPLARMTFNQAAVHRDVLLAGGRRLVFGGHVQGLAQASLTRLVPGLATVAAWDGCDHLAPAYEGDLIGFSHRLVEVHPAGSGRLMRFETVGALRERSGAPQQGDLLRWVSVVLAP